MTTFHPEERHSSATVEAAVPVPMTIKSNVLLISRNQQKSHQMNQNHKMDTIWVSFLRQHKSHQYNTTPIFRLAEKPLL